MSSMKTVYFFILIILISGCSYLFNVTPESVSNKGYFIKALPEKWYASQNEQTTYSSLIRRERPSSNYSIFIQISMQAREELITADDIENYISSTQFGIGDTNRFELVTTNTTKVTKYGIFGVEYCLIVIDHNAPNSYGNDLFMICKGFACKHPYLTKQLFISLYSERGLPSETNKSYVVEANQILASVIFVDKFFNR